jgi:hypothetical protein
MFRHDRCATHAPLRVNDGQYALGFESANLRKDLKLPIPMKVFSDSDWIPVTGSEVKLIVFGAKRRWRSYPA